MISIIGISVFVGIGLGYLIGFRDCKNSWKEEYKKYGSIIFDGKVFTEEYK